MQTLDITLLKTIVRRNRSFKIDLEDLHNYFGKEFDGKNLESVCQILNDKLLKEGITVTLGKYRYDAAFITFSESGEKDMDVSYMSYENTFLRFLENNKLYDEKTKKLICPTCYHYSVVFYNYYHSNPKWWCENCLEDVEYHEFNLNLNDKEKYQIYKLWGVDALNIMINEPLKITIKFVSNYFRNCCMDKKDKCLYFDFFK